MHGHYCTACYRPRRHCRGWLGHTQRTGTLALYPPSCPQAATTTLPNPPAETKAHPQPCRWCRVLHCKWRWQWLVGIDCCRWCRVLHFECLVCVGRPSSTVLDGLGRSLSLLATRCLFNVNLCFFVLEIVLPLNNLIVPALRAVACRLGTPVLPALNTLSEIISTTFQMEMMCIKRLVCIRWLSLTISWHLN